MHSKIFYAKQKNTKKIALNIDKFLSKKLCELYAKKSNFVDKKFDFFVKNS